MTGLVLHLDDPISEVGGALVGEVIRNPDGDGMQAKSRARAVRLSLYYRTEGRGDMNTKVVDSHEFALEVHGGLRTPFSLAVPTHGPISYDGKMIRVKWWVEARVDVKLARDPKIEEAVLIVPVGGQAVYNMPHPLPKPLWW